MNITPASLALNLANFQSQAMNVLLSLSSDKTEGMSFAKISDLLLSDNSSASSLFSLSANSSATTAPLAGRNMSLTDPESAYKMMSVINNRDVTYKAQFSELSQMQSYVSTMQDAGKNLGNVAISTENAQIKSQLNQFTEQYNSWIQRFGNDMKSGGLLADTQAAQVAVYELDQSIKNIFNGAKDGLHGLSDIGISIDPATKLASLDTAKLDQVLTSNKQGVVNTIQEFSGNFTKSAYLLNSDNNFIPNQLNNLGNAIHYIADNKASLQTEFGTGNPAKPTGQIAQALAAYNQTYGI